VSIKASRQTVTTVILHFLPDLSNAPEAAVATAPDYWHPKTERVAKAKPKSLVVKASKTSNVEAKK